MSGIIFLAAVVVLCSPLSAEIRVVSVKGSVAFKAAQKWEPLKAQMKLNPGTKISTGVASMAVLQINKHTLTINPMTMIKIYENIESMKETGNKDVDSSTYTKLGLKRGSIKAKVFRDKRVKTVFEVATPVATSSVRGTEEFISYGPSKGMIIKVIEGNIKGDNKNGTTKYLQPGMVFHQMPKNSDPEPLLADLHDKSINSVHFLSSTKDEQNSHSFSGEELVDNSDNPSDFLDDKIKSNVSLLIIW